MTGATARVRKAFAFEKPDRTPLFEIFQPYHPIYWPVCGRTVATDAALAWDAMTDGIAWEELVETWAQAQFQINRFFGVDMVRLNDAPGRNYTRPRKLGPARWALDGTLYGVNARTKMVEPLDPGQGAADSARQNEDELRRKILAWDGSPGGRRTTDPVLRRVQDLASAAGEEWVYMGEIGCGTGVAFYPPFMLMWLAEEPGLVRRWIEMQMASALPRTQRMVADGCSVIALGGDVSCDKGPFLSPRMYREFILPAIRRHVQIVHEAGARAVYTSDGNHWLIKDDLFFNSGVDGYKEVDKAAGMTWPRLIAEGVYGRVCIIGNLDARHTLCHGTADDVRREVLECLRYGQTGPGGHILHASHSVHEDVKAENYVAAVNAYREFFGMARLPW
ncbi:MAG: hypothetical protein NTW87_07975 [Planctomycetota bacterium]|nr:hypothetical protein [Planctomycetota bacterium]